MKNKTWNCGINENKKKPGKEWKIVTEVKECFLGAEN